MAANVLLAGLLALPASSQLGPCTIETVAGGRVFREPGGLAVDAELYGPDSARLAPDGSVYIADSLNNVIRRVTPDGMIGTVAGTGEQGFDGDGGPATQALLSSPTALAFGPDGSYYFVDTLRIRRVRPNGIISTVAGNGNSSIAVDGSLATETGIRGAFRVALDAAGVLYIAADISHQVWKVTTDGIIHRIAGSSDPVRPRGGFSGDGGPALEAALSSPSDVAVDGNGNIYIADRGNTRIRRVKPDGRIETYMGGIAFGSTADGTHRSEFLLQNAFEFELDGEGRLYWIDRMNIHRLDADERAEMVFGSPGAFPSRISVSPAGTMHLVRDGQVLRLLPPDQTELIAGVGLTAAFGDGGPATEAVLGQPRGLAAGPNGEIYVLDSSLLRVSKFTPGGVIERVAGTGEAGDSGDGGPARDATFFAPRDIAMDSKGNLYIADPALHIVRRVNEAGIISRFAGTRSSGCSDRFNLCGEGGLAIEADVPIPAQLEVDSEDNVYILHSRLNQNPRGWIRRVDREGIIRRISHAGIAEEFTQNNALTFTVTPQDRILVSLNGINLPYHQADLDEPFAAVPGSQGFTFAATALTADDEGNVYFSDGRPAIFRLTPDGVLNTIAGGRASGFSGDGGPAGQAEVSGPVGFLLLGGDLYFGDRSNGRVRRVNDVGACPVAVRPQMSAFGAVHAASFQSGLAPGTIFTVFGVRLGPGEGVGARIGPDGRLTTELGGTRVLVDGIPAAMVFSSATQVNAITPYGIEFGGGFTNDGFFVADRLIPIQVEYQGVLSEDGMLIPFPYVPALFTLDGSGQGQAAALNQDGSVNGPLNPAAVGTVIVLFATGEGQTDPPGVDGKIAVAPLPKPLVEVKVLIDGQPAQVLYAGAAPFLTAGVIQVNAVIPPDLVKRGPVSVQLVMGAFQSASFGAVIIVGE